MRARLGGAFAATAVCVLAVLVVPGARRLQSALGNTALLTSLSFMPDSLNHSVSTVLYLVLGGGGWGVSWIIFGTVLQFTRTYEYKILPI